MGSGFYINTVAPEECAEILRTQNAGVDQELFKRRGREGRRGKLNLGERAVPTLEVSLH